MNILLIKSDDFLIYYSLS